MKHTLEKPAQPAEVGARFGALRHRNFLLIWSGLVVSNTGTWMQMVALGWLILEMTHSAFYLGLAALFRAIPMLIFPLLGGVLADRIDKIRLLVITQTTAMLLTFVLATLTVTGSIQVWHVMTLAFLSSAVLAFDQPTRHALLPDLVPRKDMANAIATNSVAFNGSGVIGPAVAGILIAPIGVGSIFYINAFSYLAVLVALSRMRLPPTSVPGPADSMWRNLQDGLGFIRGTPVILSLLSISTATSIFGTSYHVLVPVFAIDILDVGAPGLGFLAAAPGAGTVLSGFGLAFRGDVKRKGFFLIASCFVFALFLALFAISPWYPLSLASLMVVGAASTLSGMMINTLMQVIVPNEMRGRVMSAYTLSFMAFIPLGGMLLGAIASVSNAPLAVVLGAVVVCLVTTWIALSQPLVRRLES